MSKRLEIPSDLEHLIEKRDEETDRRGRKSKPNADAAKTPERRKQSDRRGKGRRKSGS